jgi:fibronectin type 3 domain-containing protein
MKFLKTVFFSCLLFCAPALLMGSNRASATLSIQVASVTQHTVSLTWDESSPSDPATLFYIYRSTVSGGSYSNIASSSTTAYVDGTVTSGVTYYYVVTAVDASSNESGHSNQATAVVPSP